jgi:anti-sigma regulatory factor (Ser/Thr protein kinase)
VSPSGSGFAHGALLYDDLDGFLEATVPFLREGLAAGEPALVAVEPAKLEALRAALPDANGSVRFVDMTELGRNPGRIISAWSDFAREHGAAPRLRGVGEPVWPGRSPEEVVECQRHEALLNVAFADRPGFSLLCPYDRRQLDTSVLGEASRSHVHVVADGAAAPSSAYDAAVAPFAGTLADPPASAEQLDLGTHPLAQVRQHVVELAEAAGLETGRVADLVLSVSEAVTNTLCHAGGRGMLRTCRQVDDRAERVVCEVRDHGRLSDPLVGRLPVSDQHTHGRGLWLIHQLCDLVQIRSTAKGTVVRMQMETGA